jgi:proteasome accessory factor B
MPRADRLFYLVEYLRLHPFASKESICRELEITERTFFRDLNDLRRRNVLIEYDPQRRGYYLANKNYIQSLTFTEEELLAIQMALNARPLGNTPFGRAARLALDKIKKATITKADSISKIAAHSFMIEPTSSADDEEDEEIEEVFNTLHKAWHSRRVVQITYESRSDPAGTPRERLIEVYGMFSHRGSWYVVGFCHHFRETRTFKLKRIKQAVLKEQVFTIPADFSLEKYLGDSWELLRGEPKVKVVARFAPSIAHLILEKKYHPTQEVTILEDGSAILQAYVAGWKEFSWWLRQFGDDVEALEPPELRADFARLGRRFLEIYEKD